MIIDSPIISGSYLSTGSLSQTGNVSITGSLTATAGISGSFSGSGADLFGIPATGITGLNLSQISSGSVSASISPSQGLLINTSVSASNFTGSFTGSLTGIATSASYASFSLTSSYSLGGSGFPFSGAAVITGSLLVSGSAEITGSLSVSGSISASLFGTASQATSASYALTASYLLGYISPFPFTGSAAITGSLIVTGSVSISTLTTGSGVRYVIADQNGLLSAQTASAAIFTTQQVVSTAGQTTFPITNGYSTGYVTVFVNGTKLSADEYVDTSGTNIVFLTGSNSGDNVEFQKYLPAAGVSNNTLRSTNYFTATTGQTNFSVNYTPGLIDIFYNGAKLDNTEYTAANGTSITLATASAVGDRLEVDVYSYQVGAFSGIGGTGAANQLAYFNTSNSITGSNAFTVSGSAVIITGSLTVSGSGTFTNIGPAVFSGSVTSTAGFSGSFSGTADSASYAYTASSATNAFNSISASYAYTASSAINAFSASKAISSSYAATASFSNDFTVLGNLTVFGTQSVQYITSSQLNISDNVITVNVASPGVRFGGLSVFDSGSLSSEATASLFWDSQNNHWIYQRESGSTYNGGMLISGPRNSAGLGNELGTTNNSLMKGQGGDHITSSAIFEVSGSVTMGNALTNLHSITGSINITGSVTASLFSSAYAQFNPYTSPGTSGTPVFQDAVLLGQTVNACKIQYGNSFIDNNGSWLRFVVNNNTATSTPVNVMTLKYDGNVGIGITNPAYILDISGSGVRLKNSGGSADFLLDRASTSAGATSQYLTNGTLVWYTGLRGLANNNFYVFNNATSTNTLILDASTNAATFGGTVNVYDASSHGLSISNSSGAITFTNNWSKTTFTVGSAQDIEFNDDGGVKRLFLKNGGNVGIGTSSPAFQLDVAPGTASATVRAGSWAIMQNVTTNQAMFGYNAVYATSVGSGWRYANNGYAMAIRMHDAFGTGDMMFHLGASGTAGAAIDASWDTSNIKMIIKNDGKVGIGTIAPGPLLHIYDASSGSSKTYTKYTCGDGGDIRVGKQDGVNNNAIFGTWSNNDIQLYSNSTERIRITSAGTFALNGGVDGTYQPMIGGMYNANNNETNLISTAVSSVAGQSGFRFDVSNGAGSSARTTAMTINRSSVTINGTLSKGGGSFRIDHPLPTKKDTHLLLHSFIEGPTPDLIYRGVVNLVNGTATINIDEVSDMTEGTFVLLNKRVQCFTTNESGWDLTKGKVEGNILTITSQNSESTDEISWMVVGERQDEWMKNSDMTDEDGKIIVEKLKPTIVE